MSSHGGDLSGGRHGGGRQDVGRGGRGGRGFPGRGDFGGRNGGRGRGRGVRPEPTPLWDASVKWHFDEPGDKPEEGMDEIKQKGMNKRRAREYHIAGREGHRAPSAETAAARAALELRRFKMVKRLRHLLALKCGELGLSGVPLLVFERWLARAMLDGPSAVPTPMLPTVDAGGGLGKDLKRAGVEDLAVAAAAATELAAASKELGKKLTAVASAGDSDEEEDDKETAKTQAETDAAATVVADDAGPLLALKLNDGKPYMTISKAHAGKLRALYCRHSLGGAPLPPDGTPENKAFLASMFALLARYEAMAGAGYQAALGETAFDVLKLKLGVGCEAFASPLNCRYGRFCSAFPDVDTPFGSLGSFFTFKPTRGSFEMNPPFVPETLLAAAQHAERLLDAAQEVDDKLSFVVVVPVWKDTQMWDFLENSKHKQGDTMVVKATEHGFCDGAQHCRPPNERHRVSSYDTGVFFLQTTKGAARWRVTDEIREELRVAMKDAVGSAKTVKDLEKRYRGKPEQKGKPEHGGKPREAVANEEKKAEKPKMRIERIERRDDALSAGDEGNGDNAGDEGGEKKKRRRRRKKEDE